jgi:hypothetical protein
MMALEDDLYENYMINILLQVDHTLWQYIAQHFDLRYHTESPGTDIKAYEELWDIYGISKVGNHVDVGLHLRSGDLLDTQYLPLVDPRFPSLLEYSGEVLGDEELIEYSTVGFQLQDSDQSLTLGVHSSLPSGTPDQNKQLILLMLKTTIKTIKSTVLDDLRSVLNGGQVSGKLLQLNETDSGALKFMCQCYDADYDLYFTSDKAYVESFADEDF